MKNKIKSIIKKFKDKIRKIRGKIVDLVSNSICYFIYYHIKIKDNWVFVESRDGKDFTGNILRIVEEISKDEYPNFKIFVYAKKGIHPDIKHLCDNYGFSKLHLIDKEYHAVAVMECAKYIVSDSGIPWKYVKREGQVVLNTWHGTPLKVMGRQIEAERHSIGTVQHFFFSSDYILYPSQYMKNTMLRDYMVENVISGKSLMGGYPRNDVFFDVTRRAEMRKNLGFEGKKVFAYMPTHRGTMWANKNNQQLKDVLDYLTELDAWLENDQVLMVKLHVFNQSKIDFAQFQNIIPFPKGYETYDVLNTVDCLVTDYSSVFFDFANSRNKIILFAYDEEEYFEDRGTYFPLEELPFPVVRDVESLLKEMNLPKNYDDTEFLRKYCPYDSLHGTYNLCQHVFKGNKKCIEAELGNGKENVLVFGGSLVKNGITAAFSNLLSSVDSTKRNYYASFKRWEMNGHTERLDVIPTGIDFLPLMSDQVYTIREYFSYKRYRKQRNPETSYPPVLKRMFQRELDRYYWGHKFSHIIQFDGYGLNVSLLFLESDARKTIFVHNDMQKELQTKSNQHWPTLRKVYREYDNVAVVSPDIVEATAYISGKSDNIKVVNNLHNCDDIRRKSEQPIEFQKNTEIQCWNPGGIEGCLMKPGYKFITVGRFSKEKGHQRLLKAFDQFCETYPDSQLIIIGGYGTLYQNTKKWANQLKHWKNVTIIKSLDNPMAIMRRCDLFVLSSFHEGLPMTIKEADMVGLPVVATDIPGVHSFQTQHQGYLCDNSEQGILEGMHDFVRGNIPMLNIDYAKYNERAIAEFEDLF